MAKMYTEGKIQIFSKLLLLCSAFVRLVQGYLKAKNDLNFYLLLNFCESHTAQAFLSILGSLVQGQCPEQCNIWWCSLFFLGQNLPWFI